MAVHTDQSVSSTRNLPYEVITHIMRFLPLADRISARQACHSWYEASQDLSLRHKEAVVINGDPTIPSRILESSRANFLHFILKEVDLQCFQESFWKSYCPKMHSLTFHKCSFSERTFLKVLYHCHKLQSLCIHECREFLMSGRILDNEDDMVTLKYVLKNLRKLSMTSNRYLSDAIFNRFVELAPNIEDLSLARTQISFHNGLFKKFYPEGYSNLSSESVLTFYNILQFITAHANQIKSLDFGNTLIDNAALSQLAAVSGLNLNSLVLSGCDQLSNKGILCLTDYQQNLTTLDLSDCSRVSNEALLEICTNIKNLKFLNLQNCRGICDKGISKLHCLKYLISLNLSQCELVTGGGIQSGLCTVVNKSFKELSLASLFLDEETVCKIAETFPYLTHLDLSWCHDAVTDQTIQAICNHLIWLRSLKLHGCKKLTDAGLTGMVLRNGSNISDNNHSFSDEFHKISLRNRAEEEIVKDAKRKNAIQQLCEENISNDVDRVSLSRLRGLQVLDLWGCNNITDVSLKYAFRFLELRYLDLSHCQQITAIGLSHLALNNPSIEVLILNQCYNVSDGGILSFLRFLWRLKHLEIQGCTQLTTACVKYLREYKNQLTYLDVSRCSGISKDEIYKLQEELPSINIISFGMQEKPAAKPPTPPKMIFFKSMFGGNNPTV